MLPRRAVLLAALAALPAPALAARLRPGTSGGLAISPLPQERVAFHAVGLPGAIILPVTRAHIAKVLPLGDRDVAVVAFAADPPPTAAVRGRLDMAAIVGWDGTALRVLALEVLAWRGDAGTRLATRIAAVGDRSRVRLERAAAVPRSAATWSRESWTDMLAWQDGGPLVDTPVRPPLAGTWQQRLGDARAVVAAHLVSPCQDVTGSLATFCVPPDLADAPAKATPTLERA